METSALTVVQGKVRATAFGEQCRDPLTCAMGSDSCLTGGTQIPNSPTPCPCPAALAGQLSSGGETRGRARGAGPRGRPRSAAAGHPGAHRARAVLAHCLVVVV